MSSYPNFDRYGYQVQRELGQNCTGGRVTYLATNTKTQLPVVIKQFQFAQIGSNWAEYDRYQSEIKILQKLNHPHIPRYLDAFDMPSGFCLVQEYKNAPSLAQPRYFNPQEIKQIAVAVLEVLVYLQQQSPPIIHRDIKPENILVDRSQGFQVYLVDFGFARLADKDLAVSSVIKGTLGFMPPEQLFNRVLTEASDLYSLGATLVCLLTKTKSTEVGNLIDDNARLDLKSLSSTLNPQFQKWLKKMTAANVKQRYANAREALEALKVIDVTDTKAKQRKVIVGFIGLGILASLSIILLISRNEKVTKIESTTVSPQLKREETRTIKICEEIKQIEADESEFERLLTTRECRGCYFLGSVLNKFKGINLKGSNLEGAKLPDADLENANLENANLQCAELMGNLERVDLEGANLEQAIIGGNLRAADLRNTNLSRANLRNAELSNANLKRANLVGADLEGTDLSSTNLERANLEGADLEYANLWGAKLWGVNLKRTKLNRAKLDRVNLNGVNLEGADLRETGLNSTRLERANLQNADLEGADLKNANLKNANLKNANLKNADLKDALITGANFQGATMPDGSQSGKAGTSPQIETPQKTVNVDRASQFRTPEDVLKSLLQSKECPGCDLSGINLEKADLVGANLEGAKLIQTNLRAANLEDANLVRAYMIVANLQNANLSGAELVAASLGDANLEGANLGNASLGSANLRSASLNGANLWRANLWSANLVGVNLKDANLIRANLSGANLGNANLGGANLERASLKNANLGNANLKNANLKDANLEGANLKGAELEHAIMPDGTKHK
jgi:uncharacterized protein YjbI with pentapeptide repeats